MLTGGWISKWYRNGKEWIKDGMRIDMEVWKERKRMNQRWKGGRKWTWQRKGEELIKGGKEEKISKWERKGTE